MVGRRAAGSGLLCRRRMDVSDQWLPGRRRAVGGHGAYVAFGEGISVDASKPLDCWRLGGIVGRHLGCRRGLAGSQRRLCRLCGSVCRHRMDGLDAATTGHFIQQFGPDIPGRICGYHSRGRAGGRQLGRGGGSRARSWRSDLVFAAGRGGRCSPSPFLARGYKLAVGRGVHHGRCGGRGRHIFWRRLHGGPLLNRWS